MNYSLKYERFTIYTIIYLFFFIYCTFTKNKDAVTALLRRARELNLPPLPASLGNRVNFWNILDGLARALTPFEIPLSVDYPLPPYSYQRGVGNDVIAHEQHVNSTCT